MAIVHLRPGKQRPVLQRHPWIFSGAIARVEGYVGRGDVVDVHDHTGEWLARGTWSSGSQIRVRLYTWDADEPLDEAMLRRRIARAVAARAALPPSMRDGNAQRLVFAESEGLPGLIVDRYGEYLVVQLLTQGAAARADLLVQILAEQLQPRGIYERSDADVREKEDLLPSEGLLWGEPPPAQLEIVQHGRRFGVSLEHGQKTGFYLDQAENRQRVAACCHGKDVLDGFCYTGGFSMYAATAGAAHVTALDSSGPALELLHANAALNGAAAQVDAMEGDVFKVLRQFRAEGRQFDVVVLDPPKFVQNQSQVDRAARAYKDINLLALHLLRPGGVLATFSCSGLVSADLFQKIVWGAAVDARRDVQIIERLTQSPDHPVLLTFPEGEYLKGLICRVW